MLNGLKKEAIDIIIMAEGLTAEINQEITKKKKKLQNLKIMQ